MPIRARISSKELEFNQTWNLGCEVMYQSDSPFRELLGKSNDKVSRRKYKVVYFRVLFA